VTKGKNTTVPRAGEDFRKSPWLTVNIFAEPGVDWDRNSLFRGEWSTAT
jgi:hypothetical protein